MECASSKAFERAAQRFRVRANQKHRHPFKPLLSFDAVLKSGPASFNALGERHIADVLSELPEERVVTYVHNLDENNNLQSPARYFNIWERTLPSWCTTPDNWIDPIPPPGFAENPDDPPPSGEQYYRKVPTLHVPGSGRHIIPSAKKPDIISRTFYIPVVDFGSNVTRIASLEREADLVPHDAHLVPGKDITLDAARALLGRVVQHSTEPRPDPTAPPQGKRLKVNKFAAQKLGLAWGLETDADGRPAWLFCLEFHGMASEYAIDLSGENRLYEDLRSPIAIRTVECAWVGAAVLPADTKAMQGAGKKTEPEGSTEADKEVLSYDDWYKRTKKWIRALNKKKAPLLEVRILRSFIFTSPAYTGVLSRSAPTGPSWAATWARPKARTMSSRPRSPARSPEYGWRPLPPQSPKKAATTCWDTSRSSFALCGSATVSWTTTRCPPVPASKPPQRRSLTRTGKSWRPSALTLARYAYSRSMPSSRY